MRVDDLRLLHLEPQVVAFAGALAHAGEDRYAAVLQGDIVDQLHDDDSLADTSAAEQPDLPAAQIRLKQVDDLDSRLEHLERSRLVLEARRRPVNRIKFLRVDRAHLVDGLSDHVEHAPECLFPDRHHDRRAEILGLHAAHQSFGRLQRDGAHAAFADMLLDFADDVDRVGHVEAVTRDADRGVNRRNLSLREFAIHRRAGHLHDPAEFSVCCFHDLAPTGRTCSTPTPRPPRR